MRISSWNRKLHSKRNVFDTFISPWSKRKIHPSKRPTEVRLEEIGVEFDEDKIIVSDVRDEAHLNIRRATQGKYEQGAG
jgi:hypothetical protein